MNVHEYSSSVPGYDASMDLNWNKHALCKYKKKKNVVASLEGFILFLKPEYFFFFFSCRFFLVLIEQVLMCLTII